jgi:secondary thiamine-phosphate synthase enzyme
VVELTIHTSARMAICDITAEVNSAIERIGVREGLCNLFVSHTTTAVIVSENWDPDVTSDLLGHLEQMVPRDGGFKHSEGNSQAHILSVMLGTSINIPLKEGKLALGRWQGVMLAEFDGPRERNVRVSVIRAG